MLLFAIAFCLAGWWYVSIKNHGQNVTIFGKTSVAKADNACLYTELISCKQ